MRALLMALLGTVPLLCADSVRVDVIRNEVWITRNPESDTGVSKQLTHDGKAKSQAELSSVGDRIAYYEQCPESEHCTPSVVILDLEGNRLQRFQPQTSAFGSKEPCGSILEISWVRGNSAIGVECHATPSESLYIEYDLATGRNIRDLVGLEFTPSPDGKFVAHVGPLTHFAPPYAKSYFLFFDDTVVYPLPKGARPFQWKIGAVMPDVLRIGDDRFVGIHSFGRFAWAPDSTRVAFIDYTFDWIEKAGNGDGEGSETNRRCSIAVVSATGAFSLVPLQGAPFPAICAGQLSWVDDQQLKITFPVSSGQPGLPSKTFRIQ